MRINPVYILYIILYRYYIFICLYIHIYISSLKWIFKVRSLNDKRDFTRQKKYLNTKSMIYFFSYCQCIIINNINIITKQNIILIPELERNLLNFAVWRKRVWIVLSIVSLLLGPLKLIYVYNGIVKNDPHKMIYTRSICTLLYINFDGLYIIMNSP